METKSRESRTKIKIRDLWFSYGKRSILENISLDIPAHTITSVTGPSGQGKSSFLTVLNRLWPEIDGARARGEVNIDFGEGFEDINRSGADLARIRRRVGMVFQAPNPLPMSIFQNVAFPLKLLPKARRKISRDAVFSKVASALKQAFLWEEVKDRLDDDAALLSGGQQQRLCIARALVLNPGILLLDEPTSSLDEDAVHRVEQLLLELKKDKTIVLVSHYTDQVKRIADQGLVLRNRRLVGHGS